MAATSSVPVVSSQRQAPGSHVAPKESLKASKREIGLEIDFPRDVEDSYVNRSWVYSLKEGQLKDTNELNVKKLQSKNNFTGYFCYASRMEQRKLNGLIIRRWGFNSLSCY